MPQGHLLCLSLFRKMEYSNTWKFQYFSFFIVVPSSAHCISMVKWLYLVRESRHKKGKVTYQKRADSLGFVMKKKKQPKKSNRTPTPQKKPHQTSHSIIVMVNYEDNFIIFIHCIPKVRQWEQQNPNSLKWKSEGYCKSWDCEEKKITTEAINSVIVCAVRAASNFLG